MGSLLDLDTFSVSSGAYTIKGNVTVGEDDTGHDVKFFEQHLESTLNGMSQRQSNIEGQMVANIIVPITMTV